jgi:hypothetical protein
MTRFVDLPPELRVQIASYLSSKDLAALARVNKGQVTVARERLYHSVEMNQPDEGHRLMSLLRTLFAHPELLQQIRSISLAIVDSFLQCDKDTTVDDILKHWLYFDMDDSFWCPEYRDVRENLCVALKQHGVDPDENYKWFHSIQQWCAVPFYGALLAVLPNLERVALSCYDKSIEHEIRPATKYDYMLNKLLGNFEQGPIELPPSVIQLFKVKGLDFEAGYLSPKLMQIFDPLSLKLGSQTAIDTFASPPWLGQMTRLDVCIRITYLIVVDLYSNINKESIRAFSSLKHVVLRLEPPAQYSHQKQYPQCLELALADVEAGSARTLETLSILPLGTTRNTLFHNMNWIPDFPNFVQLRSLTFIHGPRMISFKDTLPASLDELSLLCTSSLGNVEIDDLVHHKITFGNLRRLNLDFQREYDADPESACWDKLTEVKVDVCIRVRQHTLLRWIPA